MPSARPRAARTELSWSGWGDPALAAPLTDDLRTLLGQALGITGGRAAPASIEDLELASVRLVPPGGNGARGGGREGHRTRRSRGRSPARARQIGPLRLRGRARLAAPDLVLAPAGHGEVLALLSACARHRVAVTPFGGGTSVVGGLAPGAA